MAAPKVNDERLLAALTDVFRTYGYEGASLSRISTATQLERASLYHRFPGGKADMAAAVVQAASEWLREQVFAALEGPDPPAERIRAAAKLLGEFYHEGRRSCLLDTLSLPDGSPVHGALREGLKAWLSAFAKVSRDAGVSAPAARERAEQAVIDIEGALVLSRVLADNRPFLQVLKRLPAQLTSES